MRRRVSWNSPRWAHTTASTPKSCDWRSLLRAGARLIHPIPAHGDIAARVSTTRETVARVFSDLARKKIVVREKGELAVLEPKRLKEMVHEFKQA